MCICSLFSARSCLYCPFLWSETEHGEKTTNIVDLAGPEAYGKPFLNDGGIVEIMIHIRHYVKILKFLNYISQILLLTVVFFLRCCSFCSYTTLIMPLICIHGYNE